MRIAADRGSEVTTGQSPGSSPSARDLQAWQDLLAAASGGGGGGETTRAPLPEGQGGETTPAPLPEGQASEIKSAPAGGTPPTPPSPVAADEAAMQMADLSAAAYNDSGAPPGWHRLSDADIKAMNIDPSQFHPTGLHFGASLFRGDDGRVVLAFRGTDPKNLQDWQNNIQQGFGQKSEYYTRAIQLAQSVSTATHGDFEITGHSLGGGMAAAAGVVTGAKTTTFNAPGVTSQTLDRYHKTPGDATRQLADGRNLVDSYVVKGEIVNTSLGPVGQGAVGVRHELDDPHPVPTWKRAVEEVLLGPGAVGTDMLLHSIDIHNQYQDALKNKIRGEGGTV